MGNSNTCIISCTSHRSGKPNVLEFHWGWCDEPPLHRGRWCRKRIQTGIDGVTRRIHLIRSWRSPYDFDVHRSYLNPRSLHQLANATLQNDATTTPRTEEVVFIR